MKIEQQFIAITLDDGATAIMGFLTQGRGSIIPSGPEWADEAAGWWSREATDENIFDEVLRTSFGEGRSVARYRRVSPSEVPQDRTYRNAWKDDGTAIVHDMPKAREIHRDRLRRMRVPLFEQNDIALADALVEGDEVARQAAVARRNALRDVTKHSAIDTAQTIEELKTAVPSALEGTTD